MSLTIAPTAYRMPISRVRSPRLDKHDVGDPHTADQQADSRDRGQEQCQGIRNAPHRLPACLPRHHAEIVLIQGTHTAVLAEYLFDGPARAVHLMAIKDSYLDCVHQR